MKKDTVRSKDKQDTKQKEYYTKDKSKDNTKEKTKDKAQNKAKHKKKHNTYEMIRAMFKVGLLGFGGGNALIPLIENEAVDQTGLVTEEEYEEDVLVASITPGALPVEIAGGVGRRCAGVKGLLLGSFAMAVPGVLLTILLSSVITKLSDDVLMQIRFLAVGVTAFIACLLTEYINVSGKQAKENGILPGCLVVAILVFILTCGKNVYRLFGINGKPPVVLSTIQIFGIAFVLILLFGRKYGKENKKIPPDKNIVVRTAKEIGLIFVVAAAFLLASYILIPETLDYAAKGFLSSIMSFGGGDAYLTVADGLFVQTKLVDEGDFYSYLVPIVNIIPGSILCKTLAGVGYFMGYERTGTVAGGVLVSMTGFFVSLLASCGVFDIVGCFHERFKNMYVLVGIRRWVRPIVSGLMLTVILSLVVQNKNLGVDSGLGTVPIIMMIFIYIIDLVLIYRFKFKNGMIVFFSSITAFIVCNLV